MKNNALDQLRRCRPDTKLTRVVWVVATLCLFVEVAQAELKPLQDEELAEISGQALIALDTSTAGDSEYIRATLGMEINTQLNIEEFRVGEYHRWENGEACFTCDGTEPGLERMPADIWVQNLSLGSIAEFSGIQMDGRYYEQGEIVPFQLFDPYVESYSKDGELIGFRVGVREAVGTFGGNIRSITGNFPVKIKDTASALVDAPNRPWWIALGGALLGSTPVESQARLVTPPNESNGQIDYSTGGQLDPIRATHVGLPDGADFRIGPIPFIGNINFNTTDCNLFGIPTCFPFSQFESLEVGERQTDGTYTPAEGWFLSVQKEEVDWVDPVNPNSVITAPAGAFFSVPVGGVELNLEEAFNGIDRKQVEFINRNLGLF